MGKTIEGTITRCIMALNVVDVERLFANMDVISGYIERKPIFLEWLTPPLVLNEDDIPIGFSGQYESKLKGTVQIWLLAYRALMGNMRLQTVRFLNLNVCQQVYFRPEFQEAFSLDWLYLPLKFGGELPDFRVGWLSSSGCHRISIGRWCQSQWVLVLEEGEEIAFSNLQGIIGIDGTQVSSERFIVCCQQLAGAPIQWLTCPESFSDWSKMPQWVESLEVLLCIKPTLDTSGEAWLSNHLRLRSVTLRQCQQSSVPSCIRHLVHLEHLDLSLTPLGQLPMWFDELVSLHTLNIAETNLVEYPEILSRISSIQRLFIRSTNAYHTRDWLKRLRVSAKYLQVQREIQSPKPTLWRVVKDITI